MSGDTYSDMLDKGYACLRRGDPDAAKICFRQASRQDPARPQGYFGVALAYLESGLHDDAKQALEQALQVDPTYVPARAYLGIELLRRYDLDGAQEALDQALRDEPANLLAHIKYAEYYYRVGFYHRSVEMLERGLNGPHRANEHVVAIARQLLVQARQKRKGMILREPPDPRRLLHLFDRLLARRVKRKQATQEAQLS